MSLHCFLFIFAEVDLARGKHAFQSSDWWQFNYPATLAVNEITDGILNHGSVYAVIPAEFKICFFSRFL